MVTDPVAAVEPATPAAGMSYGARLGVTLFLLSLFVLGHWVPLPFVAPEIFAWVEMPRTPSLMMLETTPLFVGFILVELFALATSPGRRLRAAGPAGRAKLNRAALIVGLALSAVQAFGIASVLANMTTPGGMPAASLPGPVFRILLTATLTAVTAALFFLASFLSEYGIGNGFSLLILTQIGLSLWQVWAPRFMQETAELSGSSPIQGVGILLVGILTALLIRYVQTSEATRTPPFPQSTLPLVLAGAVVNSSFILPRFFEGQQTLPWFAGPVAVLFAVPFFSWPAYHLFSSRGRLKANLSEPDEVLDGLSGTLERRFLTATALLTVGGVALTAWSWIQPDTYVASLTFLDLLLVTAIAFDLRDQFVFLRRSGATARLVQLDNVHLSYRLVARLEEEGIGALARGHHHRALLFFLGPMIKIDVLVPRDQLDEAQAVLAELESAREIKVF
jgi:preprotein translocase subunit SecY